MNICGDEKMEAMQVIETCTSVPRRCDITSNNNVNQIWKPVSHSHAVECMMRTFDKHGISVVESAFALNRTGHLMVGGFQLTGGTLPQTPSGIDGNFELFMCHANDMSLSMQLNAGMNLFVCTNGMMTGDRIASRKHTLSFDMQMWADNEVLPAFIETCGGMDKIVQTMQHMHVSDGDAHKLILEAAHQGILPLARTVDVYREWHEPTFSDFEEGTAWKLYNDFTYVAQKCSPARQHKIIEKTHELITSSLQPGLLLTA